MSDYINEKFVLTTVLPFLVGWLSGSVGKKWELSQVHDSVLRRCHLDGDWSHVSMRKTFCAIVNGRMEMVGWDGNAFPGWRADLQRKLVLLLGTILLVATIAVINSGASKGSQEEWKLLWPVTVLIAWVYFTRRLRLGTVRTKLNRRSADNAKKWDTIILKGERADDGIPTKDAGVEA